MKLKKASAWFYNKSGKDIILDELGVVIKKNSSIDIFSINPLLPYEKYINSLQKGVLFKKRSVLIPLLGAPESQPIRKTDLGVSKDFRASQTKSSISVGKEERDWVDMLEGEFPAGAQPLSQEEAWNIERQKVIKNLDIADTGEEGEVFSDKEFDFGSDYL